MKRDQLTREIKARVSEEMYAELEKALAREEEGIKISDLVRRAVRAWLDARDPKKVKAAKRRATDAEVL